MKKSTITRNGKTIYKIEFNNLTDVYNYLKSNPEVSFVFKDTMASQNGDFDFAGEEYESALEYLKGGYKPLEQKKFIKLNKELLTKGNPIENVKELQKGIYGGVPQASLVAANVPDCMLRYETPTEAKEINIYFQLGYRAYVSNEQVKNRGLATLYLIQALEEQGYITNFYASSVAEHRDEIIDCTIKLQSKSESSINVSKCYYPLVGKEFLRRLIFRIRESTSVKNNWSYGYGSTLDRRAYKEYLNAKENDIVIGAPDDMGIEGFKLYDDINSFINNLEEENNTIELNKIYKFDNQKGKRI